MYKIKAGSTYVLDPSNDIYVDNPKLELEANVSGSLSFTIYDDNPGMDRLGEAAFDETKEIVVYKDDQEIWAGRMLTYEEDFDGGIVVECEGELAFLDDSIQVQARYQNISVQDYLQTLLDIHNSQVGESKQFQLGLCTVVDSNDSIYRYTNFESTLNVIKTDLVETFGGYLRIRKENGIRYLDYLNKSPRTSKQTIELNKNLIDNYEEITLQDYATVIYPLGAVIDGTQNVEGLDARVTISDVNDGKPYLTAPSYMLDWLGWKAKVVEWDDVNVASILKTKAQNYLDSQEFMGGTMTVKAVDLKDFGLADDDFQLLDMVSCITTVGGSTYEYPVTAMTIYLMDPEQNTLTLGGQAKTYTSTKTSQTKKIESALATIKSEVGTNSYQKAQDYVNTLLNLDGKNGHIIWDAENGEILIMDTTDKETAVKVWRFNIYGWAYSGTGYNGPFSVATTEDGLILGQYIAAGTITAEQLSVETKETLEKDIRETILSEIGDVDLSGYYTAAQVDQLFSVDNASLKSVITETANKYTDEQLASATQDWENIGTLLSDYTKSSDFTQTIDEIKSSLEQTITTVTYEQSIEDLKKYADDAKEAAISESNSTTTQTLKSYYKSSEIDEKLDAITLKVESTETTVSGIYGVKSWTTYYKLTNSTTVPSKSASGWSTTYSNVTTSNKYGWAYDVIEYTNGNKYETAVRMTGKYGDTGATGETGATGATGETGATGATGTGISSVEIQYYRSSSNSTTPSTSSSSWTSTMPSYSSSLPYVWTRLKITYTDGTIKYTTPVYDKSTDGKISQVKSEITVTTDAISESVESLQQQVNQFYDVNSWTTYYLNNNSSATPTTSTSGWSTTYTTPTATKQYTWAYDVVKYVNADNANKTYTTSVRLVSKFGVNGTDGKDGTNGTNGTNGTDGKDGVGIASVAFQYARSSSTSTAPTSGWSTDAPTFSSLYPYFWTRLYITYTDGTTATTDPYYDASLDGKLDYAKAEIKTTTDSITESVNRLYVDTDYSISLTELYLYRSASSSLSGIAINSTATSVTLTSTYPNLYIKGRVGLQNGKSVYNGGWQNVEGVSTGTYRISSVYTMYVASDSETTEPDSSADWSKARPATDLTKYLWIKIRVLFSNGFTYDFGTQCVGRAVFSRIAETESELKILSNSISSKVSQTDFDELGKTVSNNTTKITQTANSLSSYCTTTTYDALEKRVTTAESNITQTSTSLSSYVKSSEFSTLIEQNSSSIRISWNKISNYIQFENAKLNIYDSTSSSRNPIMSLSYKGMYFHKDGVDIGAIGTNCMKNNSSYRGLVFDLENTGNYMAWAYLKNSTDTEYTIMMAWYAQEYKGTARTYRAGTFYFDCNAVWTSGNNPWKEYSDGSLHQGATLTTTSGTTEYLDTMRIYSADGNRYKDVKIVGGLVCVS